MLGILVVLCTVGLVPVLSKVEESHQQKHYDADGEHNSQYDHEAFLGEQAAQAFRDLPLHESKQRLAEIFDKVDEQILKDRFVTEEELGLWIKTTKKNSNVGDAKQRAKKNDANGDGYVSWDEYKQVSYGFLNNLDPESGEHEDERESLRHDEIRFKQADLNSDMKLTVEEFSAFAHPEDHDHMIAHMVNSAIGHMDKDKDGQISQEEYLADLWQGGKNESPPAWLKTEQESFSQFHDKNGDGQLDAEEVREWILPHDYVTSEAKHLIDESDKDHDGKLSKEEMLDNHKLFVGSTVTEPGYGGPHEEL